MKPKAASLILITAFAVSLSSCGDFKKARSKRIVQKAFEHQATGDIDEALKAIELADQLGSEDWELFSLQGQIFYTTGRPEEALKAIEKSLALLGDGSLLYEEQIAGLNVAKTDALTAQGKFQEANDAFEKALKRFPDNDGILNNFAWFLSICPVDTIRDGERAVKLGIKACEATGWNKAAPIDTLAAAYAEAGDFKKAVKHQKLAMEIIQSTGQFEDDAEFKERLNLFENGKPFRRDYVAVYRKKYPAE